MPKRVLYNRFKVAGHVLFWIASIVLLTLIFKFYETHFHSDLILKSFLINIGFAAAVYVNLYVLIPVLLKKKNYIFYFFWLIVMLSLASLLIQLLFLYPFQYLFEDSPGFRRFDTGLHADFFFATLAYVGLTSFLKFIKDWLYLQEVNLKLAQAEQQKLEAELKTLKGQLNPHFLFNSLNNIYSLSLVESPRVPELILKLSDLMRHIIYESRENYIPVEKEIEFVNNFIALQKIRVTDQTRINYKVDGEIKGGKIAPLLFEPFIDNAFKHGMPGTGENDFINIFFSFQHEGVIEFRIENNYENSGTVAQKNSGIGISNVKQRLKHLYPNDQHKLEMKKENSIFRVELTINLK